MLGLSTWFGVHVVPSASPTNACRNKNAHLAPCHMKASARKSASESKRIEGIAEGHAPHKGSGNVPADMGQELGKTIRKLAETLQIWWLSISAKNKEVE